MNFRAKWCLHRAWAMSIEPRIQPPPLTIKENSVFISLALSSLVYDSCYKRSHCFGSCCAFICGRLCVCVCSVYDCTVMSAPSIGLLSLFCRFLYFATFRASDLNWFNWTLCKVRVLLTPPHWRIVKCSEFWSETVQSYRHLAGNYRRWFGSKFLSNRSNKIIKTNRLFIIPDFQCIPAKCR